MYKKTSTIVFATLIFLSMSGLLISCSGDDYIDKPRKSYMPDMYVSRALETYAPLDYLHNQGISFNASPAEGTIKRGRMLPYYIPNTPEGYIESAKNPNPLPPLTQNQIKEVERKYLIHCGICHGAKLDGNGPLYKSGEGPYPAKPATLVGDATYEAMTPGTMFHSLKYGKNLMGSYASQLSIKERWMIVHYIKYKQANK